MIKRCPFCNGQAVLLKTITDVMIQCGKCGCRTVCMLLPPSSDRDGEIIDRVANRWNRRADAAIGATK